MDVLIKFNILCFRSVCPSCNSVGSAAAFRKKWTESLDDLITKLFVAQNLVLPDLLVIGILLQDSGSGGLFTSYVIQ